ncbi:MAG: hypothetical protein LKJ69_04470 [Lactobacillus sp.]|jgi:uncharacterized membrane protein (DUF106 family)|nr:hypothetical protein [Lactobacillus sp.]MCI2032637.1 hypothetical protein [Lactobacillus sp.]
MQAEQIDALINLTPMKMITENMKQVTEAISESYEANDNAKIGELVHTGNQLLDAIAKLSQD